MSEIVLNRDQVRQIDRRAIQDYGIPGIVLMENAGRGVADTLWRLGIKGQVIVCCGRGNNGGDGLVVARHLDLRQVPVKVLMWCDPDRLEGDAATNYQILARTDVPVEIMPDLAERWPGAVKELTEADWIVDALLGTGATGSPRPPVDRALRHGNASRARRLAIDVPSGVDCDTGEVAEVAFRAHHTCTFVAPKPGLLATSAQGYVGQLHVLDIGAPRNLIQDVWASP
jgi:NAD(P)H-hydrate epimerase